MEGKKKKEIKELALRKSFPWKSGTKFILNYFPTASPSLIG